MKIFSIFLVLILLVPSSILAQTASTQSNTEESVVIADEVVMETKIDEVLPTEVVLDVNQQKEDVTTDTLIDIETPQDTVPIQEAIQGVVLEETLDPQASNAQPEATTTEVLIIETATSTDVVDDDVEEQTTQVPQEDNEVVIPEPVIQPVQQIAPVPVVVPPPVIQITQEELEPEGEYTIALDGQFIATTIDDGNPKTIDKVVTDVPDTSLIAEESVLNVSDQCVDPYFVILIYRNVGDYESNPSSYIFNKAFDCVNGHYSYSISELPKDLEDGRYYLLVGGQGLKGSWRPVSALVPITLNRNDE